MLALNLISAFGVSADYWEGNPLSLGRGESKVVNLNLQNNIGSEDVTVQVTLKQGSDIASISKDTYFVAFQTSVPVPVTISLPSDAIVGDLKKVLIEVKTITSGDSGMVAIGTGYNWAFDVQVKEPEKKSLDYILWLWVLVLLIAIVLVSMLVRGKKSRRKR